MLDSAVISCLQSGVWRAQRQAILSANLKFCLIAVLLLVSNPSVCFSQWSDVKILTLDGNQFQASITSIDTEGRVVGKGLPPNLHLSEITQILIGPSAPVDRSTGLIRLNLVNGGKLNVSSLELDGETLKFESTSGVQSLPLQTVSAIIWNESPLVLQQAQQPLTSEDRVIVAAQDDERMVQGLVEGLNSQQLSVKYQNESRKINVNRLNAVIMADIGAKPLQGSLATVTMSDAAELKGLIVELTGQQLRLQITESVVVELLSKQVSSVAIQSDRQQFLSDLEPIDVRQSASFTIQRTWQRDKSIEGNVLTLRSQQANQLQEFKKGLGTQSYTQLDFANEGGYTQFKASVGIDAETKGKGDCLLSVRGDGIELWTARVKGNESLQEIDVDISGMKVVSLIVSPGAGFDLADHANWCNARFVK